MGNLYLCRPGGTILGTMSGLDENSVTMKQTVGTPWELSFTVSRYVYDYGKLIETTYYHSIEDMMELYLDTEEGRVRFQINQSPTITNDGVKEQKGVIAHSIECELQDKILKLFQINTGQEISQENLVRAVIVDGKVVPASEIYNNKEYFDLNVDPYTRLPVDYITIKNTLKDDIALLKTQIENGYIEWDKMDSDTGVKELNNSQQFYFTVQNDGELVCGDIIFPQVISNIINTYPRIGNDLYPGYDARVDVAGNPATETYGEAMVFRETYLKIKSGKVYICPKTYSIDSNYNATLQDCSSWGSADYSRFLIDGLSHLVDYYEKFAPQLSMLDLALQKVNASNWSIGDVPDNIAKIKMNFNVDSQDIYSFFTQACSKAMKVIFDFDRLNKKVNIIDIENTDEEHDTGVFIGLKNLMNSVDIKSSSEDGIKTKFKPQGADGLGIYLVNFGDEYMINLDYFINKTDEYGDYQYVSNELHDKYHEWLKYRDGDAYTVSGIPEYEYVLSEKKLTLKGSTNIDYASRREAYADLSRRINQSIVDIDEFENLVPVDATQIDYTTFPYEDLKTVWIAYNNAFDACIQLYAQDYATSNVTIDYTELDSTTLEHTYRARDEDGNVVSPNIKDTMYWHDFVAYWETILPNVFNALKIYVLTDSTGSYFIDGNGNKVNSPDEWIVNEATGNPVYNNNPNVVSENVSNAYKYDMSLYGRSELEILKKAWIVAAEALYKEGYILDDSDPNNIVYNTADTAGWNRLATIPLKEDPTKFAQSLFVSEGVFIKHMDTYLDYVDNNPEGTRVNGLTKWKSQGIIEMAKKELEKCESVMKQLQDIQDLLSDLRLAISESVTFEGWTDVVSPNGFTPDELNILYTLLREADYSNENILTTSLENISVLVNTQEELYQDASKKLFEKSRPQYSFNVTLDNMFAIEEFKVWRSSIAPLNYIYLILGIYDNEMIRLRIVSIERNPLIPTETITLGFSNMVYTYDGLSDLAHLLGDNLGGGASSSGSSSSSVSGGSLGENDAEIQISNNMLNALLRNNSYYANFSAKMVESRQEVYNELEIGNVVINGECLVDNIHSKNYDGNLKYPYNSTQGSILNLADGTFSFAGDKLKYYADNSGKMVLSINGNLIAGKIGSGTSGTNIDLDGNTIHIGDNSSYLEYSGGNLVLTGGTISGNGMTIDLDNGTLSLTGSSGDMFSFDSNGNLKVKGDIETTGTISGDNIEFKNTIALTGTDWSGTQKRNIVTASVSSAATNANALTIGFASYATLTFYDNPAAYCAFNCDLRASSIYGSYIESSGGLKVNGSLNVGGDVNTSHVSTNRLDASGYVFMSGVYNRQISGGRDVKVDSDGEIHVPTSSRRFKHDITENLNLKERNPLNLYNIPVVQFKYNDGSLNSTLKSDEHLGMIAEDIAEQIPEAAYYDEDGLPCGWDSRTMLVSAIKCIQDLHSEIVKLKEDIYEK